jgi:hypothetical protein
MKSTVALKGCEGVPEEVLLRRYSKFCSRVEGMWGVVMQRRYSKFCSRVEGM